MSCYDFNGQPQNGAFSPCITSSSSGFRPCCGSLNNIPDKCLPNDLCQTPQGILYRGGCTDPTFSSTDCPKICPYQFVVSINNCGTASDGDEIGCCEYNNNNCSCDAAAAAGQLVRIASNSVGLFIDSSTSTSAQSTSLSSATLSLSLSSLASTSSSASSATTASSASTSSSRLTSASSVTGQAAATNSSVSSASAVSTTDPQLGLKVGIPVAVVAVLAIIAAVWFFLRRRSRHAYQRQTTIEPQYPMDPRYRHAPQDTQYHPHGAQDTAVLMRDLPRSPAMAKQHNGPEELPPKDFHYRDEYQGPIELSGGNEPPKYRASELGS